MRRIGWVLVLIVGAVLGFIVGRVTGAVPAPVAEKEACPTPAPCPSAEAVVAPRAPPVAPDVAPIRRSPPARPTGEPLLPVMVVDGPKSQGITTADRAAWISDHPTWTPDWPADLTPAEFPRRAEALEDCPGEIDYLGTECEEPPCYVVLASSAPGLGKDPALSAWLASCPSWAERYGSTSDRWTRCSRALLCGDQKFWFLTVTPQRALDHLAGQGFEQEDLKALQQQRCDDATTMFQCPS